MTASTAAERQAKLRERKRNAGLRPYEVWCKPEDWPAVQAFVKARTASAPSSTTPPNAATTLSPGDA
jgi:hypothetical protein